DWSVVGSTRTPAYMMQDSPARVPSRRVPQCTWIEDTLVEWAQNGEQPAADRLVDKDHPDKHSRPGDDEPQYAKNPQSDGHRDTSKEDHSSPRPPLASHLSPGAGARATHPLLRMQSSIKAAGCLHFEGMQLT